MAGLLTRTLRDAANESNPNKVPQVFRNRAGDMMNGLLRYFRGTVASDILVLPADAKAVALQNGFIIAGTGGTGPLDPVAEDATLASGQATIAPNGDIIFFTTDAVTEAEVWYHAQEPTLVEITTVVIPATGVASLSPNQAVRLIEAEALAGTVTGVATILQRGTLQAGLAAGEAALQLDGATVEFLIADAVTSARLKFVPQPGFGPAADSIAGQVDDTINF